MIYVDATSTCKSDVNTGVARMVRGIWNSLAKQERQAFVWNESLNSFCKASELERKSLKDVSNFVKVPGWRRQVRHYFRRFNLGQRAGTGDCILIPEIFQDTRIDMYQALSSRKRIAMIAIFHDAIAWKYAAWTAPERRPRFEEYMATLAKFHRVICVSQEAARDLKTFWDQRGLVGGHVCVRYWPTDFPGGRPNHTANPAASANSLRRILCVSSLEQRKNHLKLLEAAEILWKEGLSFSLEIIGKTCPDWGGRVIRRVKDLQDAGRPVEWKGGVNETDLHQAYSRCDFTVYPSLCEGYGLPIVESLWHGRPCVCGSNGALGEVAKDGGCLTVDMQNAESIASGIRGLLIDPQLFSGLCDEAKSRTCLSWEDYGNNLLQIPEIAAAKG